MTTQPPAKPFGIVEWFHPGEHARVERALDLLDRSGAAWLRTHVSWAEYVAPGGEDWYDWLLPRLAARAELLPCVHYTPPSLSRNGATTGAPRVLKHYADFVDHLLTRHGEHFTHVELWNEPNNLLDWDWRADPDCSLFSEMIGNAAHWVRHRGWKPVLGAPCPFDPHWLDVMGSNGILALVDAVGCHGFPGTWDSEAAGWRGWTQQLADMRAVLDRHHPGAAIWITETGYSTWRHDEAEQCHRFLQALAAPAERLYWYGLTDIPAARAVQEGHRFDDRHYHLGLWTERGRPKLLGRLLSEGGPTRVRAVLDTADRAAVPPPPAAAAAAATSPAIPATPDHRPVAIVGGAGFIGCNLADDLLADDADVLVVDNLSRAGAEENLAWLRARHGGRVRARLADIRDASAIAEALHDAGAVFHFAAQTAVTTSLLDPRDDFAVNAVGTFNVLEAVRALGRPVPLIFSSTNKVYGALSDLAMREHDDRYEPLDALVAARGIDERRPLDFCTPYGCSKGTADQYVLDYGKCYDLPTAVLRMSCIYGPRQFGTEDQGWVAHFLMAALRDRPITLYGDGKQVRDILHVRDAVDAYRRVLSAIDQLRGRALNLGGGTDNAVSLRELLREIGALRGRPVSLDSEPWRQGDQPYFVADTAALERATGWHARIPWREGVRELFDWLARHRVSAPAPDPAPDPASGRMKLPA